MLKRINFSKDKFYAQEYMMISSNLQLHGNQMMKFVIFIKFAFYFLVCRDKFLLVTILTNK